MSLCKRLRAPLSAMFLFLASAVTFAQEHTMAKPRYTKWWLPDQASTVAPKIDNMFYLILYITTAVFIGVFVTQIFFMIRYRQKSGGKAIYSHGNNRLEIAWTLTPAAILIFLGVISQTLWSEIKQDVPAEKDSWVVEIRPRQFQWDVRYSGTDGKFGTPDDIEAINNLHVPEGKMVLVKMTAQDVIHSFFVPEFRMKQDAVPGLLTQYWFTATKSGEYDIACAELCGLGHYKMKGRIFIHPQAEFDAWYTAEKEKRTKALTPPPPAPAPASGTSDSTQPPPQPPASSTSGDSTQPPPKPPGTTTDSAGSASGTTSTTTDTAKK
jgi:cytochrome c oxidase subunit 2